MARSIAVRRLCGVAALILAALLPPPAHAQPDEPVLAAIQSVQTDKRAALQALRSGDADRADHLLRRMEWRFGQEIATVPRIRSLAEPGLSFGLAAFDQHLAVARALTSLGDLAGAAERLDRPGLAFEEWRRSRRTPLLADCLDEFGRIFEALETQMTTTPAAGDVAQVQATAIIAQVAIDKCDAEAHRAVRRDPTFRELVDGLRESFVRIHTALGRHDVATLGRELRRQRSLERAIALRFG